MNKLDELFNEKLSEHSIAPSDAAWGKIEAGLSKKNSPVLWLRWAAVFVLSGFIFAALWMKKGNETVQLATETKSPVLDSASKTKPKTGLDKIENKSVAQSTPRKSGNKSPKKSLLKITPPVVKTIEEEQKENLVAHATPVEESTSTYVETSETSVIASTQKPVSEKKSIVLTYTLETVVDETPAVVASNDNKESPLRKVVQFAKDMKNGESPLAGLRMEDLFALDHKKKTTVKNN